DRGNADGDQVEVGAGRIALEVAVQLAFALRERELVFGLREVVHPDVAIARRAESLQGQREERELRLRRGKVTFVDAPLRTEHARQVRIVIERDAFGRQRDA